MDKQFYDNIGKSLGVSAKAAKLLFKGTSAVQRNALKAYFAVRTEECYMEVLSFNDLDLSFSEKVALFFNRAIPMGASF